MNQILKDIYQSNPLFEKIVEVFDLEKDLEDILENQVTVKEKKEDIERLLNNANLTFEKEKKRVKFKVVDRNTGNTIEADTIENVSSCVEGPSLMFYARAVSHSIGLHEVSTFVDGRMGTTELIFRGEKEEVEIGDLDEPVRARVFTGQTKWGGGTAVAGMAGDFAGWFSDDEAAVPLRAEMKVIVGSIVIELEEWTRAGWVPPTGRVAQQEGRRSRDTTGLPAII